MRQPTDRSPSIVLLRRWAPSRIARAHLLLGTVVACAAASLGAQRTADPPAAPPPAVQGQEPPPRFRTEANYVRVDVYPTRDGRPVEDLALPDFEVLENGVKQQLQAFERVVISPAGPQSMLVEPNTVRGGEQMAANPRNRVFVIFLDTPNVDVESGHHVNQPLIRLIDRVLGPDDLVAVMTPEMAASQIAFGRKTEVIAGMLTDKWYWGGRNTKLSETEREQEYAACFPPGQSEVQGGTGGGLVQKMIRRRRERATLDALRDLVIYLGGVREERKAILTVTQGWVLYKPDPAMNQLRALSGYGNTEAIPGSEPVGVDEFGKLRVGGGRDRDGNPASLTTCEKDRMFLSAIDDDEYFRRILDDANRNNASFYPIDPRGLAVFDAPIGPDAPPLIKLDQAALSRRVEVLRTLAENTDGVAVVNSNDLDAGMRRVADDLSSYYLLGYYSTNTKLDGQFRRITVKVRRPGVDVRARRGYRAATADEVNAARLAGAAPVVEATNAASAAIARLGRIRPEQRLVIHAAPVRSAPSGRVNAVWVAGELQGPLEEFDAGGTATIEVTAETGVVSSSAVVHRGDRAFLVRMPVQAEPTGTLDVRVRLTPAAGGTPVDDVARLEASSSQLQPLLFRRGLSSGNRFQPAAGCQFSRTDRLRLEVPVGTGTPGTGRLLDRNSQPLQIPVLVGERSDPDGQRWLTADATLSALAAGDYLVELTWTGEGSERRVLTGIRVTR